MMMKKDVESKQPKDGRENYRDLLGWTCDQQATNLHTGAWGGHFIVFKKKVKIV